MDEIKEILSKAEYRDELDNGNVSISAALTVKQVQDMSAQIQALFDKRVEGIFKSIEKIFVHKPSGRFLGTIDNPKYQAVDSWEQ